MSSAVQTTVTGETALYGDNEMTDTRIVRQVAVIDPATGNVTHFEFGSWRGVPENGCRTGSSHSSDLNDLRCELKEDGYRLVSTADHRERWEKDRPWYTENDRQPDGREIKDGERVREIGRSGNIRTGTVGVEGDGRLRVEWDGEGYGHYSRSSVQRFEPIA